MLLRIEITKKTMKAILPKMILNFVAWFIFTMLISFWLFVGKSFNTNISLFVLISIVWFFWGIYFSLHLIMQSDYVVEFNDTSVTKITKNKQKSFNYEEIANVRYIPIRQIMYLRKKTGFFSLIHTLGFEVPSDRLNEIINILKSKNISVTEQGLTQYGSKKL